MTDFKIVAHKVESGGEGKEGEQIFSNKSRLHWEISNLSSAVYENFMCEMYLHLVAVCETLWTGVCADCKLTQATLWL